MARIFDIQQKQLDRITSTPESNPLYRSSRLPSLFSLPKELIEEVANHVANNRFVHKAKLLIAKILWPVTDEGMAGYEKELENIIDEVIVRARRGVTQQAPAAENPDNGSITQKNS